MNDPRPANDSSIRYNDSLVVVTGHSRSLAKLESRSNAMDRRVRRIGGNRRNRHRHRHQSDTLR